jgi:hypothetical protein
LKDTAANTAATSSEIILFMWVSFHCTNELGTGL